MKILIVYRHILTIIIQYNKMQKTIKISDEYTCMRLGGIINIIMKENPDHIITSATLEIANNTLYGNFDVPIAVGFSTPNSLLKGGMLRLCFMPIIEKSLATEKIFYQFHKQYKRWASTYSGIGVRMPTSQIITEDKLTCSICQSDYSIGDNVYKLDCCDHMFHRECIQNWIVDKCEWCSKFNAKSFAFHNAHTASLAYIGETSCPICSTITSI